MQIYTKQYDKVQRALGRLVLPNPEKRNTRLEKIAKKLGRTTLNSTLDWEAVYDNAVTGGELFVKKHIQDLQDETELIASLF